QQQQQQQPHSTVQRSSDYMTNMPIILRGQSTIPQDLPIQIQPYRPSTDFSRENTSRPIAPVPNVPRPPRPSKSIGNPYAILPIRPSQQYPTPPQQPLIPTVSSSIIHSKNA
ncbi:unnamed protein product, partial [Rotaria socialis]